METLMTATIQSAPRTIAGAATPPFSGLEGQAFDAMLIEGVGGSGAGFHFEEGGCWGMAAALYQVFVGQGFDCGMRYQPEGFVHAWLAVGELNLDHQGHMLPRAPGIVIEGMTDLFEVAGRYGVSSDEVMADMRAALPLVENAWYSTRVGCGETRFAATIQALAAEFLGKSYAASRFELNDGHCDNFAGDLDARLSASVEADGFVVENGNFQLFNADDQAIGWDWELLAKWGIAAPAGWTADQLDRLDVGAHVWYTDSKLHYDVECPNGVASFFDLPLFRRQLADAKARLA